jgi:hypothetical protein
MIPDTQRGRILHMIVVVLAWVNPAQYWRAPARRRSCLPSTDLRRSTRSTSEKTAITDAGLAGIEVLIRL